MGLDLEQRGEWYNQNTQARLWPTRRVIRWAMWPICCWSPASRSHGRWDSEGNSVQSRQLIHATGESFPFDVPITAKAQPNLVVSAVIVHEDQLLTRRNLSKSAGGADADITATPSKPRFLPGETAALTCWRGLQASRWRPT